MPDNPVVPRTDLQARKRTEKALADRRQEVDAAFEKWWVQEHPNPAVDANTYHEERAAYSAGYEEGFEAARASGDGGTYV